MTQLLDAVDSATFTFVTGKGGTGKTTAAGALALELADAGTDTHLISTDPAHSLGDLFRTSIGGDVIASDCAARLTLEEFDADAYADLWLARSLDPVVEIVEAGTYLDGDDVMAFSRLALPGLDEMMAVLRLADLGDGGRTVVVDTAPTGHTLRLLDAAATHEGIARALRAMADKAAAVAGSFARQAVRLTGERVIDELEQYVDTFRTRVLGGAAFVITTRDEPVVAAETRRLRAELDRRGLRTVAIVTGHDRSGTARSRSSRQDVTSAAGDVDHGHGQPPAPRLLLAPHLDEPTGCDALRAWAGGLARCISGDPSATPANAANAAHSAPPASAAADAGGEHHEGSPAGDWLTRHAPGLLLFAGKGGVGKSTCAAAAALALSDTRNVLLCSTDPAGSIDDVFGAPVTAQRGGGERAAPGRLRTLQIDPQAELAALREAYQADLMDAMKRLGLSSAAEMDRRVIEALWELAPPGIDEVAALTSMLDNATSGETVVFDTAPTGHFLRLLSMPDIALDWTRQLMRVVVKYGLAGSGGGAAEALLRLSRELRALQQRLHADDGAGVIVVTLEDALVTAETARLEQALDQAGVNVLARLTNRGTADAQPRGAESHAASSIATDAEARTRIVAPAMERIVGERALREFVASWKIVG